MISIIRLKLNSKPGPSIDLVPLQSKVRGSLQGGQMHAYKKTKKSWACLCCEDGKTNVCVCVCWPRACYGLKGRVGETGREEGEGEGNG